MLHVDCLYGGMFLGCCNEFVLKVKGLLIILDVLAVLAIEKGWQ